MQLKKILVAVKPWERGVPLAAAHARHLSEHANAEIELVGTVFDSTVAVGQARGDPAAAAARGRVVDMALVELERCASSMRGSGLRLTTRVVWGVPAYEVIVRSVAESSADLLVVSAFEPETSHSRLTDTDWQLMRRVACPLLFVKTPAFAGYRTVLTVIDPQHLNSAPDDVHRALLDAGRRLAAERGATHIDCAADVVVDLAIRQRADLVIVAAPRSGAAFALGGATSERVAAQVPCDVLIVPAAADEARPFVRSQVR